MTPIGPIRPRPRFGVTLLELIVSIGALVVVLGLALGMMEQSGRASRLLAGRQQMLQQGQQALLRASRLVGSAIAPQNLALSQPISPIYTHDRLALIAFDQATGQLSQIGIEQSDASDSEDPAEVLKSQPIASAAGGAAVRLRVTPLLPLRNANYQAGLAFDYADAAVSPGAEPQWKPDWSAARPPQLVRITVSVSALEAGHPPLVLRTVARYGGGIRAGAAPTTSTAEVAS